MLRVQHVDFMKEKKKLIYHDLEILKHIQLVRENIGTVTRELGQRADAHDASKLEEPERALMAEHMNLLGETTYGTPEYEALLEKIKPALEHHYANNRHHPQHWPNGVDDMDLIDLCEMLADWIAATKRNKNGNIHKSIEVNAERFNISPQLAQIMRNTVERYFS
jgi:hypothetical protein